MIIKKTFCQVNYKLMEIWIEKNWDEYLAIFIIRPDTGYWNYYSNKLVIVQEYITDWWTDIQTYLLKLLYHHIRLYGRISAILPDIMSKPVSGRKVSVTILDVRLIPVHLFKSNNLDFSKTQCVTLYNWSIV